MLHEIVEMTKGVLIILSVEIAAYYRESTIFTMHFLQKSPRNT